MNVQRLPRALLGILMIVKYFSNRVFITFYEIAAAAVCCGSRVIPVGMNLAVPCSCVAASYQQTSCGQR